MLLITKKEQLKLILMCFCLPLIPCFLFYKHNFIKLSIIILLSFWVISFLSAINLKFASVFYQNSKKLFEKIGEIIAIIALFFIYIITVIPTSILMNLCKRDRLRLKKQNLSTYWIDIKKEEENYEHQF